MFWFIITVILWIAAIACFVLKPPKPTNMDASRMDNTIYDGPSKGTLNLIGMGIMGLWIIVTVLFSLTQVGAGQVGVVYQFSDIIGQRGPGLQFVPPWQSIVTESVQIQRHKFEKLAAFSRETQDVFVDATLNFSVSPDAVQGLYRNVGRQWFTVLIDARMNNFLKEETVKYSTVDIAPKREAIRLAVMEKLGKDVAQFSISIENLLLDNVDFRPEFKAAIEQKQIATQDALRELERVKQRTYEGQQAEQVAIGRANAIEAEASGQAKANRLLNASLTDQLIQFQAMQKLSDKVTIALLPSGQGLIIDPTTMLAKPTPKP